MQITLDANIWILGILEVNPFCTKILLNLTKFEVVAPNQIRAEVERNLSTKHIKRFYSFISRYSINIDFAPVPLKYIEMFETKGLKKGDTEIGGFCEWR